MRPKHLRWKASSPTASTSSSSSTSGLTWEAIANASRIDMPLEYVRTGMSMKSGSSAKATISSNRASTSRSERPWIEAFM